MFRLLFDNLPAYICVFVRLGGIFAFNPVFSRRNLPAMARTGIVFCLTLLLAPGVSVPESYGPDELGLVICILKELTVGALFGYVFNIYYYMMMLAGDIVDSQSGFSMAKTMDPATQVQSAFTGNLLNYLFLMYFFVSGSHLVLIKIAESTFDLIPVGVPGFSLDKLASFGIDIVSGVFSLALRLVFPFVAVEFVIEVALGVLMKLIPQIHVFVINMQLKIFISILLLLTLMTPLANFLAQYTESLFEDIQKSISVFT